MSDLSAMSPAIEQELREKLPASAVRDIAETYVTEPRGLWRGKAGLVLAPETTEQVAAIMRVANAWRVPVIPLSGGTGLVGGQLSAELDGPIILSTERLDRIRGVYADENVLIAEAGVILQNIRDAADAVDRLFPLMLASQGSARIGGNLATNAGGMTVLRYGNARDLCVGIEAVLPDGAIFHGLKRLRKDNTGYDIKNLLIGSEGTLGIITAAALRLFTKPQQNLTALLVVSDPAKAAELLGIAREHSGEMVSIFELLSGTGFDFINETMPDTKLPFDDVPTWMVLIEIGLPRAVMADQFWDDFLGIAYQAGVATDGVAAQSEGQRAELTALRELIPEANTRIGSVSSHDISLPISAIPDFVDDATSRVVGLGPFRINCFGHLGDGNLHFNVYPPKGDSTDAWQSAKADVARIVYDLVDEFGGSFSAEHGIGRLKVDELARYGDPGKLRTMRAVKSALDPHGIMNPGVIFRLGEPMT